MRGKSMIYQHYTGYSPLHWWLFFTEILEIDMRWKWERKAMTLEDRPRWPLRGVCRLHEESRETAMQTCHFCVGR